MRNALLATVVGALVLAVPRPALANGRFPAANQLVFSATDTNLIVLRTTFGILFSRDAGATWHWLCEDVLGLPSNSIEDPSLALTRTNTLVAGTSHGMELSSDTGCSWGFAGGGLTGQLIKDIVVRPDAPDTVLAITSVFEVDGGVEGGAGYQQQVFQSVDDGVTFAPIGAPIDPAAIVTTLEVATSDPQRLYVSAFRGTGATRTTSLFVSVDAGAHWIERPTPFNPAIESAVYIAAVDPKNADRVYVRTTGQSRLLVTSDAGKTFQVALTLNGEMYGFAMSPDGTKVYAGSKEDGLMVAPSASLAFAKTSTIRVQCLATHGADLWACSDEPSGFVAGVSPDDGATFTPKLHLNGIAGPIACPADASAAQCAGTPYQQLCQNLGGCADDGGSEAGDGDGGIDGGAPAPPASKSSCGCSAIGSGGAAGVLVAGAMIGIAARRRRRTGRARGGR